MNATVYNQKGEEVGKIKLSEKVFGMPWNADLVHQVFVSMRNNRRTPVAHTKNRGEVRGGGRKPWQQKGLGRARHGSTRSPIWVHGGVAHGPRNEKNFGRKINKKMKGKSLAVVLSKKFKEGEVIFLDALSFNKPSAKEAKVSLTSLARVKGFEKITAKKANAAVVSYPGKSVNIDRSFSNFKNISVAEVRNLNLMDLLQNKYLILAKPEESLKILESRVV